MRIRDVRVTLADIPVRRPHVMSFTTLRTVNFVFVRLETAEGLVGWGEAACLGGPTWSAESAESVAVTGTVQLVDTVSGSVKEVVDETRVRELPLNGRNVLQLQQLVNGAIYTGSGDQQANTPAFQVNGGTSFNNNYTLDGGEHSDSFFNSAIIAGAFPSARNNAFRKPRGL